MKVRQVLAAAMLPALLWSGTARAELYDLERAINVALDVSTQVGVSREQLSQSRSQVLSSYSAWLPNLQMNAYTGHSFSGPTSGAFVDNQGRVVSGPAADFESYSFSLNSGMQLFHWGSNWNRLSESKENADASAFDLEYQKDFIKAMVIREYYDLVRRRKLRVVQEDDVEAQTRNLEQVEAFYKIGSRTKADFLQARVNLANSELELINRENAESIADARLKTRLNLRQMDDLQVDESLEVTVTDVDVMAEAQYMLDHRSDLLAGRSRINASKAGLSAAKKGWLPALNAGFSYGWNDRQGPSEGQVFKQDYVWQLGLSVSWPIFDRFATKVSVDQMSAQFRIAEYNLQQSKLDAVLDLKQIVVNLEQARKRLDLAEETVEQAEENQRLAEERYRVGAGTVLETFAATASLTQAQGQLIDARVDYLINQADLLRATGRDISSE